MQFRKPDWKLWGKVLAGNRWSRLNWFACFSGMASRIIAGRDHCWLNQFLWLYCIAVQGFCLGVRYRHYREEKKKADDFWEDLKQLRFWEAQCNRTAAEMMQGCESWKDGVAADPSAQYAKVEAYGLAVWRYQKEFADWKTKWEPHYGPFAK
jgi:hypothetical protein